MSTNPFITDKGKKLAKNLVKKKNLLLTRQQDDLMRHVYLNERAYNVFTAQPDECRISSSY